MTVHTLLIRAGRKVIAVVQRFFDEHDGQKHHLCERRKAGSTSSAALYKHIDSLAPSASQLANMTAYAIFVAEKGGGFDLRQKGLQRRQATYRFKRRHASKRERRVRLRSRPRCWPAACFPGVRRPSHMQQRHLVDRSARTRVADVRLREMMPAAALPPAPPLVLPQWSHLDTQPSGVRRHRSVFLCCNPG